MLKSVHLKQVLSFRDLSLELRPLNVLIGPNASGKSNLLEVIALLQSLPSHLADFVRTNGGVGNWLWKGEPDSDSRVAVAEIEAILDNPTDFQAGARDLRYVLGFGAGAERFQILTERLENRHTSGPEFDRPYYYFEVREGFGRIPVRRDSRHPRPAEIDQDVVHINPDNTEPGQSILRERRDPENYPVVTGVAQMFRQIRLYREWNIGRRSAARMPQPTDGPFEVLLEDFSNLALVMNRLQGGEIRGTLDAHMRKFYEHYDGLHPLVEGGTIQLTLVERGLNAAIPATRLSDGTIRFISLLAILCNPKPPPLLCIEEPELALHPDIIPLVAELLRDASQRTQLIVTTHSRDLIDEFTDEPEDVVVCERDFDSSTQMRRLSRPDLEDWLERYTLGQLWEKGEIGGTRW